MRYSMGARPSLLSSVLAHEKPPLLALFLLSGRRPQRFWFFHVLVGGWLCRPFRDLQSCDGALYMTTNPMIVSSPETLAAIAALIQSVLTGCQCL